MFHFLSKQGFAPHSTPLWWSALAMYFGLLRLGRLTCTAQKCACLFAPLAFVHVNLDTAASPTTNSRAHFSIAYNFDKRNDAHFVTQCCVRANRRRPVQVFFPNSESFCFVLIIWYHLKSLTRSYIPSIILQFGHLDTPDPHAKG